MEKIKKAKLCMRLYERYVDDSNQIAEVPPPNTRYNVLTGRMEKDDTPVAEETEEQRTARVFKNIANSVQEGIIMEEDSPSRNQDGKLPILDMKVWIDRNFYVVYQHYEKPMANRQILHSQSAQSDKCKRSVHVNEVVRRILNTSAKLEWSDYVAPVLTDYCLRMKQAGYNEMYRKRTLEQALRVHDRFINDEKNSLRPVHRPKDWCIDERRKQKRNKKHGWGTKGGYIAPIVIPSTPGSELRNMLKKVAEDEGQPGLKFKIVERGGTMIKWDLQNTNPTATRNCDSGDCPACKDGRDGGPCRKSSVLYKFSCQQCPADRQAVYLGETARNLYIRGREHGNNYQKRQPESFMWKHQQDKHSGADADFSAEVLGSFKDCLSRQVSEGVHIRRCGQEVLNSKAEWHQPALWKVRSELSRE